MHGSNATYRDIIRTSLIVDAQYLALFLPVAYRHVSGGREVLVRAYKECADLLSALYASQRLPLPLRGSPASWLLSPGPVRLAVRNAALVLYLTF